MQPSRNSFKFASNFSNFWHILSNFFSFFWTTFDEFSSTIYQGLPDVIYIQTSFHPHPQAVKYLLKPTNHNSEIENLISATDESRRVFTDRNQLTDRNIY